MITAYLIARPVGRKELDQLMELLQFGNIPHYITVSPDGQLQLYIQLEKLAYRYSQNDDNQIVTVKGWARERNKSSAPCRFKLWQEACLCFADLRQQIC